VLRPAPWIALALSLAGCGRTVPARLVVALPVGLRSQDVHDPALEEFGTSILSNVYEALVDIEPDLGVRPGLAEAWHSPDERTWVFTLRKGVHFSDGRPMTAASVVGAFDEARLYAVAAGLRWDPPLHRRILASRMRWEGGRP